MRSGTWVFVAAAGVAVGAVLGPAVRLDAARAAPAIDAAFGPVVVEARSRAQAYVTLRNTGAAPATLALADAISVTYTVGNRPTDLAFTGSKLTASTLPTGMLQADPAAGADGLTTARVVVEQPIAIAPGATVLVPFEFVAGIEGLAPVVVDLKLAKTAGKYVKRFEARVAKTPARSDVFYGDGSGGAIAFTQNGAFPPAGGNWTDVTIAAGVTVTVASGATIRCTGTFDHQGTIVVVPANPGGGERIDDPARVGVDPDRQYAAALVEIERGDAIAAATRPTVMEAQTSSGAFGGVGLGSRVYQLPPSHYRTGGGGGSGALGAIGGDGGGLVRILARGELKCAGTISAAGSPPISNRAGSVGGGGGGGAGGIVVLASATSVAVTGVIDVRGANGGPPDILGGSGGGGGGGLVVLAAPSVPAGGNFLTLGGLSAVPGSTATERVWAGGGGGGACVGDGGDGYGVGPTGVLNGVVDHLGQPVVPRPAGTGQVVVFEADPRTIW